MSKHPHHDLIVAWAADTTRVVQYQSGDGLWHDDLDDPCHWSPRLKLRFKPKPKPDVSFYACLVMDDSSSRCHIAMPDPRLSNILLTFDGETGALKSAEVLK